GGARRWAAASGGEARLRQAAHAGTYGEQAAGERLTRELLRGEALSRSGDVEHVEIFTAKAAARRVGHGQLDHAVDSAVGGIAHHSPAPVFGIPQAAGGVHAG